MNPFCPRYTLNSRLPLLSLTVALVLLLASTVCGDTLELLSGAKVTGDILSRDDKVIEMNVTIGKITFKRSYPIETVHAIARGEKRLVLNEKGATPAALATKSSAPSSLAKPSGTAATSTSPRASVPSASGGSKAQLDALIDSVGRTPPDWFESTPLNYPQTLDLKWPEKVPPGWNSQKNINQYIWDVVNTNPSRWREGIRLMHHMLDIGKGDASITARAMNNLGNMYHNLLEDYGRSAFWFRLAGVEKNPANFPGQSVTLAECYWRLGFPNEALALLSKAPPTYAKAKLLADMGYTDAALKLAEAGASNNPDIAYLTAGDACRVAGRYKEALAYYQKVLNVKKSQTPAGKITKNQSRAAANIEGIKVFDTFNLAGVADGKYTSSSQGYEAQVEVEVTVQGGKITDVKVVKHKEKQFYSAISDTPKKIIAKQSVKGVDATSHATITSDAIINATAKALAGS